MKKRRLVAIVAAGMMAATPSIGMSASPLSLANNARASAVVSGANELGNRNIAVALGILVLVLLVAAGIGSGGDTPSSP
jgi:hypothetical protein